MKIRYVVVALVLIIAFTTGYIIGDRQSSPGNEASISSGMQVYELLQKAYEQLGIE